MILHIVRNAVSFDSRVLKEVEALKNNMKGSEVTVCGLNDPGYEEQEVINRIPVWRVPLRSRHLPKNLFCQFVKYAEWHRRIMARYKDSGLKVIHCHDLLPLPVCIHLKARSGAKLIYDAHELETEMSNMSGARKWIAKICERLLLRFADRMLTVSPSILEWYQYRFPSVPIDLVRNIPVRREKQQNVVLLRQQLAIPNDSLLFVYLGGLSKGRGIETALEGFMADGVKHHVVFIGDGPLRESVYAAQKKCTRIHYMRPVNPDEVVQYASGADVGLVLYEDTCLNHRYCLPNKLFESLVGGVPVLASNLVDQAALVRKLNAGWVIDMGLEAISAFLRTLTVEDAREVRSNLPDRTQNLDWKYEAEVLCAVYSTVLQGDKSPLPSGQEKG